MDATVHSPSIERDVTATHAAEEPVGRLDADRLCPCCLHQLSGQPVLREIRLDFLFVRCPECGINAPVTEHPATGRWLRRLGGFVAAILVLMLVGVLALDVLASTVGIYASTWEATRNYEAPLQRAGALLSPANQNSAWLAPIELRSDSAGLDAIGRDPEATAAAWERLRMALLPLSAVGIASGIVWTLLLAHRRWYLAWTWLLVPHGLAVLFSLLTYATHRPDPTRTFVSYGDLAFYEYGPRFLLAAVGFLFAVRLASFLLMRPLLMLMASRLMKNSLRGEGDPEGTDARRRGAAVFAEYGEPRRRRRWPLGIVRSPNGVLHQPAKALLPNKLLRSVREIWSDAPPPMA